MRMLIVDDSSDVCELIEMFLPEIDRKDTACNGQEAVECFRNALAENDPYDLICMDIKMPVMDGRTAVKEIRAIEQECNVMFGDGVKIIMTTALRDRRNVMESFWKDGCDAYLVKPFDRNDLLDVIEKLVQLAR